MAAVETTAFPAPPDYLHRGGTSAMRTISVLGSGATITLVALT